MKSWLDLAAFRHCSKDDLQVGNTINPQLLLILSLSILVDSIAGTYLDPLIETNEIVETLLAADDDDAAKSIRLRIPNCLTAETAFHLVHMLEHLHECAIEEVHLCSYDQQPLELPAGLSFAIRCRRLYIDGLLPWLLPWLSVLQNYTSVFKTQVVKIDTVMGELQQDLETIDDRRLRTVSLPIRGQLPLL